MYLSIQDFSLETRVKIVGEPATYIVGEWLARVNWKRCERQVVNVKDAKNVKHVKDVRLGFAKDTYSHKIKITASQKLWVNGYLVSKNWQKVYLGIHVCTTIAFYFLTLHCLLPQETTPVWIQLPASPRQIRGPPLSPWQPPFSPVPKQRWTSNTCLPQTLRQEDLLTIGPSTWKDNKISRPIKYIKFIHKSRDM